MSRVIDLGYQPHQFQLAIHQQARRFTVVVAHRRFGKTYCAVMTLVHAALATCKSEARFGYLAPYLKQAKGVAWDYLKRFSRPIPGATINESELAVHYPNGARIRLFGGDNAEALRGLYFDGVVIDEMADLRPEVWGAVIRPALSDRRGWAFFIGTPKGVNQFSELYQFAVSGADPDWTGMLFRADESGLIRDDELASARAVMSDAQYRQEFLCDFAASSDNTLITIDQVSEACRRVVTEADCVGSPKVIGVDVARFGDDRSVIQRRWGLCALEPLVFQGLDNMQLAGRVAQEITHWRPDAVFIDAGRGEGVIDRLRQLGYSPIEVNFGGKPDDPHYANKRSEMWGLMAKWIAAGGALPLSLELKSDLCVPTYGFDAGGRIKLEAKDDIKARGLRSPDLADALALTFAHPVMAAALSLRWANAGAGVKHEYDPFEKVFG